VLHTHNHLVHHYGVAAGRLAGVSAIVNTRHRAEMEIKTHDGRFVLTTNSPDKSADLIYRATMPWTDALVMISESYAPIFYSAIEGSPQRRRTLMLEWSATSIGFVMLSAFRLRCHVRIRLCTRRLEWWRRRIISHFSALLAECSQVDPGCRIAHRWRRWPLCSRIPVGDRRRALGREGYSSRRRPAMSRIT